MKLATLRTPDGTRAVRVDDARLVALGAPDVGALLQDPDWAAQAAAAGDSSTYALEGATFAPLVPAPAKVVCVGLNYRNHILEVGRSLPDHPTLFAKWPDALIGASDDIVRPPETSALDWEAELCIVVGRAARRARGADAEAAIAGFTVLNDVSVRDWQNRTNEWLQGKTWPSTTPVGPFLVTPDELPGGVRPALDVRLTVDGATMQADNTSDLLFDPVELVEYVSTIVQLRPGDLIATGTPGGVGHGRRPPRYLVDGETVLASIEGIGELRNRVVAEPVTG